MEKKEFYYPITVIKGMMPLVVLGIIFTIILLFVLLVIDVRIAFLAILPSILVYLFLKISGKLQAKFYVQVDDRGIFWRKNFFEQEKSVPWPFIQEIDFLPNETIIKVLISIKKAVVDPNIILDDRNIDEDKYQIQCLENSLFNPAALLHFKTALTHYFEKNNA